MKTSTSSTVARACGLTLALAATAAAQTAPAPSSNSEVVTLSPFTVDTSRDRGYTAVDALAGGRTNMPIRLTPGSISSLTRTFLDDLAIQDVRDALKWAPNVIPADPLAGRGFGGQAFGAWAYNFRGAGEGQQGGPGPTRNYFAFFQNPDAYNIERIEFTRGPNSILFGLGTVGGTLSTFTKVPRLDRNFLTPTIVADNHGSLRFEVDYNLAASDRFALRVNALYDDHESWRNGDTTDKRAATVAFLYKLSDRTQLRLELEGAKIDQTLVSSTISDKASGWDGVTASETWGAAPTGPARTVPIQNAGAWGDWLHAFPVYIPNLGDKGLMRWAGGYASTNQLIDAGSSLPWAPHAGWYPEQIKLPWETTFSSTTAIPVRPDREWTYGHGLLDTEYEDLTAFLDHRLNESFDLQLSYYRFNVDQSAKDYEGTAGAAVDINKQLPDGTPNPNYGKTFADFFLSRQDQTRKVDEVRAQVNYNYEGQLFGEPWKQIVGVSASYRETFRYARQYLAQVGNSTWIDNPLDWVQNMIWGRIYLDEPNQVMRIPEFINGYNVVYAPKADGYWFDFDDTFKLTSYAVFSNTRLFNERLSIMLGARRDSYDEHLLELRRGPGFTDRVIEESDAGNTYTAGAVYYFNWLGVFANYSENILPPNAGSQPYLNGDRPNPEKGRGYDYGLRVSTNDGRYFATLSRYETESEGRNVENPVPVRRVWETYNLAQGRPQGDGLGAIAFSDTTSLDVSGYEFEITANPTPQLRLQANYALPDTKVVDFYPHSRVHLAENLPTWNAQLDATTDPARAADLRNAIASLQDALAQAQEGLPQQGTVDYTASVFANYSFTEQPLEGWSFGLGAAFTGRKYLSLANDIKHYGESFHTVDAVIAYETRIGRANARFALNVDNLLDYDDAIVTNYHWGFEDSSGRRVREGYFYLAPRTFRLTARFTF